MWKDFLKLIAIPALVYGWVGWLLAGELAAIPHLHVHKVHFVVGLALELAGVAALSHFVAKNNRLQAFLVGPFMDHLSAFLVSASTGLFARAFFGSGGVSDDALQEFASQSLFFVVTPFMALVPMFVVEHRQIPAWTNEVRANRLGFVLLASGLLLQLFAAVKDVIQPE